MPSSVKVLDDEAADDQEVEELLQKIRAVVQKDRAYHDMVRLLLSLGGLLAHFHE